jgi:CRISPR-associated protein Cmr4
MNNNKASRLMCLHALTFLHPGTGQSTGVVDLPVQREKHTGYPMIQSSGLKGSLRDKAEQQHGKDSPDLICVFGAENAETAGALAVSEARILAFPMRSLQQVFVWITCPMVLKRLNRDLSLIDQQSLIQGFSLGTCLSFWEAQPLAFGNVIFPTGGGFASPLVVEEHALSEWKNPEAANLANKVATVFQTLCPNMDGKRLVIVSDEDFQYFVRHATQVSVRIALNDRKTTKGDGGNLWYEETLPPETVFYALVLANAPRDKANAPLANAPVVMDWVLKLFPADNPYLQVGGNETVGQGWCHVTFRGDSP